MHHFHLWSHGIEQLGLLIHCQGAQRWARAHQCYRTPLGFRAGRPTLRASAFEVIEVSVDDRGVVRLDALRDALKDATFLVSIMAANNETGVWNPLLKSGDWCTSGARRPYSIPTLRRPLAGFPLISKERGRMWICSHSLHTSFTGPRGSVGYIFAQRLILVR